MTPRTRRSAARTPLTRARIVDAATALADSSGVSAATMRAIASSLGVEAMSLYNHVAGRDDILDGMVDAVFADIALPDTGDDWRAAMTRHAASVRGALLRHPWAVGLLESRSTPGPATLRRHDAVLGLLRTAGFSVATTVQAISTIDSFVYGFVLQELSLPFSDTTERDDVADQILAPHPEDTYPHLAEVIAAMTSSPGDGTETSFDYGLRLILGALEPDGA